VARQLLQAFTHRAARAVEIAAPLRELRSQELLLGPTEGWVFCRSSALSDLVVLPAL
jgi:hypothetical protein